MASSSWQDRSGIQDTRISLAYLPPTLRQTRATLAAAGGLLLAFLVAIPFAGNVAPRVAGFIPAVDAIIFVADLITASLFFAHFVITRSRALCALGCGYLFSATIIVVHGLTFPGVITETGNLFGGVHTNFRIYLLWHLGLPVTLILYVWLRTKKPARMNARESIGIPAICLGTVALSLLSCILCLTFVPALSPVDGRWMTGITMVICAFALSVLWAARRSTLDQWLLVVMWAMIAELAITALVGGLGPRSASVGFYIGRAFSLVTSTLVLVALLGETTRLYGGVVRNDMLTRLISVSQALSSEIELPRLTKEILRIAVKYSEADNGILALPFENDFAIHAALRGNASEAELVSPSQRIAECSWPESIIRHAIQTRDTVILDDVSDWQSRGYAEDAYPIERRPMSALCLPLIRHGVLGGILYLEKAQLSGFFNVERTQQLELLASQAAISLENATIYASLQEREARLRRLIDANIIGIFTWSLDGRIIDANGAFLEIIGYDHADLASGNMRWKDLMPTSWDPANDPILEEMLANGATGPFRSSYVRKDGSLVPVLIGAAQFGGEPIEGVAFVVNMTEQIRAEEMIREQERQYREIQFELAHANRLATLGHLSASIAHELNQPLQGIMTNGQIATRLLDWKEPNLDDVKKVLSRLMRDGARAGDVIARIRALIKKAPPQREPFSINEAIVEIVSLTQAEVLKSGASILTRLDAGLPPVDGDRVQVQQVVLNLVMNALDALRTVKAGSREIVIATEGLDSGNLRVAVQDTGHGIDHEMIERIFDAFYTTKSQGLGMGLSICRSIIDAHGGRLWAISDPPRGSVFYFTLPAARRSQSVH